MTLMLTKNIIQRLYKLSTIREHLFFANFNWEGLINMSIPPPMIPKLKKTDLSSTMLFSKYVKVIKSIKNFQENVKQWESPERVYPINSKTLENYEKWFVNF